MKIRTGFVSNSSSASYVIKIENIDFDSFSSIAYEDYGHPLSKEKIIKDLETEINYIDSFIKDHSSSNPPFFDKGELEERKKETKKLIIECEELNATEDTTELMEKILKSHNITYEESCGDLILREYVSMHNDFIDSMSEQLQAIILKFAFSEYKMECSVLDEG